MHRIRGGKHAASPAEAPEDPQTAGTTLVDRAEECKNVRIQTVNLPLLGALFVTAAVALSAPAIAHHSYAMFDPARSLTLHGTVKEVQWTSPHCFLQVLVPAPIGSSAPLAEWSIEMGSPLSMYRGGMRPGTFRPGDKITVVIYPARAGRNGGAFVSAVDRTGKTYGRPRP